MALINPISGLPTATVERLSDADKKNGQRERKNAKDFLNPKSQKPELKNPEAETLHTPESEIVEVSQPIDSEKVVELLEQLVKTEDLPETRPAVVSSLYEHVKKSTAPIKFVREI